MANLLDLPDTGVPTPDDVRLARESITLLARRLEPGRRLRVRFPDNGTPGEELVLPANVGQLLRYILGQMAEGNAIQIFPLSAELTTQQAAVFLNVSRPYLIKQLEAGHLHYRMVGTHRRIMLKDLVDYKRRVDADRDRALEDLAQLTQELGEDD